MNMTKCPKCGNKRKGEEYKCPSCDCYYSQLDEILATEAAEIEKRSLKGRFKAMRESGDSSTAFKKEYQRIKDLMTKKVMLILVLVIMFIFTMSMTVM